MLKKLADDAVFDFIAVGAGPANLSLAIQATESKDNRAKRWLVLEKENRVRWHKEMLLPDSRLDTHFVKDLVTLVNPTSEFTFLNYLHKHQRLEDFLNCGNTSPFRADFDLYIQWASERLKQRIHTSTLVTSVSVSDEGHYIVQAASTDGQEERIYRARNLVFGVGFRPKTICGLDLRHPRVIHSSEFLERMTDIENRNEALSVFVIGAGQSAAEIIRYFYDHTSHSVTGIVDDFAFTTKEGTAFINESYNGNFVDRFHQFAPKLRQEFNLRRKNMNYGVVDSELLAELYNDLYYGRNFQNRHIEFLQFSRMVGADAYDDRVTVKIKNRETQATGEHNFDYVVLACGYDPTYPFHFLENIETNMDQLTYPRPIVERDYSLRLNVDCSTVGKIYLNGGVSHSHGPANDVLSVVSFRAKDILASIHQLG